MAAEAKGARPACRIGVDLGGTKIEAVVLDARGQARFRRRVATPRGDYAATLAAVVELVGEAERKVGDRGSVGVGIPGAISPRTGLVKNANSTWINGQPLHRDLAQRLGREVRVENDSNCLAVSEATDGAGAGAQMVLAVILGRDTLLEIWRAETDPGHPPFELPAGVLDMDARVVGRARRHRLHRGFRGFRDLLG
jgi:predicted NBD/HSP70 family sugar kinase